MVEVEREKAERKSLRDTRSCDECNIVIFKLRLTAALGRAVNADAWKAEAVVHKESSSTSIDRTKAATSSTRYNAVGDSFLQAERGLHSGFLVELVFGSEGPQKYPEDEAQAVVAARKMEEEEVRRYHWHLNRSEAHHGFDPVPAHAGPRGETLRFELYISEESRAERRAQRRRRLLPV